MPRLSWSLLLCLLLVPATAHAEGRTAVQVVGGAGPLGVLGLEVEHAVTDTVWLSGGAGLGIEGPQAAFMPRYEIGDGVARLAVGLGLSGGPYRWREQWGWCFDDCAERTSDFAMWANAEVALVVQTRGGFRMRFFAGYGLVLNPGSLACLGAINDDEDPSGDHCRSSHQDDGERLPSAGLSLGYAF